MRKQPQPSHEDTSANNTKITISRLSSKTGLPITVACNTTVIGQGRSAKVYDARVSQYPNQEFVIRVSKSKLFPDKNVLFAFDAVIASEQLGVGRNLRQVTLMRKGRDLETHLRSTQNHRPSDQEIYRLAITVARATYELHRKDVAHRDIKPANFVILPDGRALMVDPDLAEPHIKTPSVNSKWGTHVYWREADTKEEADLWALLRTLYLPPRLECQQFEDQGSDVTEGLMTTKLYERAELQSMTVGNYLCSVIPDSFLENSQRSKLRSSLSTERFEGKQHFKTAGQLLCGLLLSRYGLFEIFDKVPNTLEELILTYQDRDPECAQLASPEVKKIIEKIATSSTPDLADIEKLKELFLSAPYASHSARFIRAASTQTQPDEKIISFLQAKL